MASSALHPGLLPMLAGTLLPALGARDGRPIKRPDHYYQENRQPEFHHNE